MGTVYILKHLKEDKDGKHIYALFLDFKKTFDTVDKWCVQMVSEKNTKNLQKNH